MDENVLPKRKQIRIKDYDYSTPGAYFITVCTANREKIFWSDRRGELCSPAKSNSYLYFGRTQFAPTGFKLKFELTARPRFIICYVISHEKIILDKK